MRRSNIVSSGAYNLFYRRRDNTNMENIDFDAIAEYPDHELLEQLKNRTKK